jgi:Putative phage serine protease XkdF
MCQNCVDAIKTIVSRCPDGTGTDSVACEVFKSEHEQRFTLGVAYPVNRPDVAVAQDGHIDYVGAEALEQAAWNYMRRGGGVGFDHAKGLNAGGRGTVVESYIYRGPDWENANGYVVKAGDWLMGIIWDEQSWPDIKSGRKRGLSPQGAAKRRIPSQGALASLREPTRHL